MSGDFDARLAEMRRIADEADRAKQAHDAQQAADAQKKKIARDARKAAWDEHMRTMLAIVRQVSMNLPRPFTAIRFNPYSTGMPDGLGAASLDVDYAARSSSMSFEAKTDGTVVTLATENVVPSSKFHIDHLSREFLEDLILGFMEAVQKQALG